MMLKEWRRNRQVNHYPGHLDKNMTTINKLLELANESLSQFPKMRSQETFAKQATTIGPSKMCKCFIIMLSALETQIELPKTYRSGKAPKTVAKKKLLYEFFSLAGTDMLQPDRVFHTKFVSELMPKLKTVLKDQKLEDQIQGTRDCDAF